MDKQQDTFEQHEHIDPVVIADFVRHEKPDYTNEEFATGDLQGNLSESSLAKAREHALDLADTINKENELVVFWVSPKQRARQTYSVYQNVFREQGIEMYESGYDRMFKESLRDLKTGTGDIDKLGEGMEQAGVPWSAWMEYWTKADDLPETTEKPEAVGRRSVRVITYLERIARAIAPNATKRLHFICIGHEEGVRDLLEAIFGQGTQRGTGPSYGEIVHVELTPTQIQGDKEKPTNLSVSYRGEEADVCFDKANRAFVKK